MTEPEQPSSGSTPDPAPSQAAGPVPPSAPYEVPAPAPEGAQPSASTPPFPPDACHRPPYPGEQPPAYHGGPQPSAQPLYGQAPPPPANAGARSPQPPYPPVPPYPLQPPYPPQPHKQKAWPWVLIGCLVVFVLGIGGCVSCTAVATVVAAHEYRNTHPYYDGSNGRGYDYGRDFGYGNGNENGNGYGNGALPPSNSLTLDDIQNSFGAKPGTVVDGRCQAGLYEVGADKEVKPGLYFFEGSQKSDGNFYVFQKTEPGRYAVKFGVNYFGNYFADLKAGDAVVFKPEGGERFYPTSLADFKPQPPYQSGLYRVGTDMPAGTYTIDVNDQAVVKTGSDCAAFVMKDLTFGDGSITDTKYVMRGSSRTVTVKDGDYLELYATTATISDHTN